MSARTPTIRALVEAKRLALAHPDDVCIRYDWCTTWTGNEFRAWFRARLNAKINTLGGLTQPSEERCRNLALDARTINDYVGRRVRHYGCRGLLRDPRMQRRYPHINCQDDN